MPDYDENACPCGHANDGEHWKRCEAAGCLKFAGHCPEHDDELVTPAAACEHGLLVGLDDTNDPRECRECDWCQKCQAVRRYDANDACTTCGRVWGSCEDCCVDPCECS